MPSPRGVTEQPYLAGIDEGRVTMVAATLGGWQLRVTVTVTLTLILALPWVLHLPPMLDRLSDYGLVELGCLGGGHRSGEVGAAWFRKVSRGS